MTMLQPFHQVYLFIQNVKELRAVLLDLLCNEKVRLPVDAETLIRRIKRKFKM